jgi:hypothetical protein
MLQILRDADVYYLIVIGHDTEQVSLAVTFLCSGDAEMNLDRKPLYRN